MQKEGKIIFKIEADGEKKVKEILESIFRAATFSFIAGALALAAISAAPAIIEASTKLAKEMKKKS